MMGGGDRRPGCQQVLRHRVDLLSLLLFLLLSFCIGDPEASWSSSLLPRGQQITNFQTQQGLLPFPEGRGPDGTLYKTDYRCEGENMTVSCLDSDGPGLHGTIQVVRGNFGRFSIAICNRHGQTDWSVNCMAPQTTRVLQQKCDGSKQCVVAVNSELFHDACPGTHKYLEIHYACLTSSISADSSVKSNQKAPALPPWMGFDDKGVAAKPTASEASSASSSKVNTVIVDNDNEAAAANAKVRKPILVTEKVEVERRVPITTPKPTTSTERTTTTTTTPRTTMASPITSSTTEAAVRPVNKSQKVLQRTTTLAVSKDTSRVINTPSSSNDDVYVTPVTGGGAAPACQPITARQLQWNWTPAGQVALQPCPIGATGLARWYCSEGQEGQQPLWQGLSPDMSDCKSVAMINLESQVREENPENVLVSSLAYFTRTKSLYGGDLEAVVGIMRTVASRIQYRLQSPYDFHDKVSHIRQVLLNVLRSAANILEDGANRDAWHDFSADRQMKTATSLMLALEENAFLLAGVTETPEEILETYETLTMTIKVTRVGQHEDPVVAFPAKPLLYVDDKISLAASDLEDNSQGSLGEAVFFSYRGLHEILSGAKTHLSFEDSSEAAAGDTAPTTRQWRLNSRIISASLGRGRHIELQRPVNILLRHLNEEAEMLRDPVCVFWDYEVHGWSDSGCKLVQTNQTFSVCQCDHLTNFALLMRPSSSTATSSRMVLRLDIVAYVVVSVIFLFALVLAFKMRNKLKIWCQLHTATRCLCCCCPPSSDKELRRTNSSHLEKCQSFYTGLSQGASGPSINGGAPYPPLSAANKSRTLGGTNGLLTSGLIGTNHSRGYNGQQTLNSTPLMMMTKPRPHITLNPYSTQLVDNLNMMMPGSSSTSNNNSSTSNSSASTNSTCLGSSQPQVMSPHLMNLTNTLRRTPQPNSDPNNEVIYRSISPHGHVYWEIDPSHHHYATNNNQLYNEESVALLSSAQPANSSHDMGPNHSRPYFTSGRQHQEEDMLLQQHLLAGDPSQVTNGLHDSLHGLQHTVEQPFQPGMVMMVSSSSQATRPTNNSSFVRTGANRYHRNRPQAAQPQVVSTVSASSGSASVVPEQLQTQVQIRDILPIQVSVKSSEYIDAKIRNTLRRNNNTATHDS